MIRSSSTVSEPPVPQIGLTAFLVSGHGGQIPDIDGDEVDGYDEGERRKPQGVPTPLQLALVIYPLDYGKRGIITDDVGEQDRSFPFKHSKGNFCRI